MVSNIRARIVTPEQSKRIREQYEQQKKPAESKEPERAPGHVVRDGYEAPSARARIISAPVCAKPAPPASEAPKSQTGGDCYAPAPPTLHFQPMPFVKLPLRKGIIEGLPSKQPKESAPTKQPRELPSWMRDGVAPRPGAPNPAPTQPPANDTRTLPPNIRPIPVGELLTSEQRKEVDSLVREAMGPPPHAITKEGVTPETQTKWREANRAMSDKQLQDHVQGLAREVRNVKPLKGSKVTELRIALEEAVKRDLPVDVTGKPEGEYSMPPEKQRELKELIKDATAGKISNLVSFAPDTLAKLEQKYQGLSDEDVAANAQRLYDKLKSGTSYSHPTVQELKIAFTEATRRGLELGLGA